MTTRKELVNKLAKAGAQLSKHCRIPFSNDVDCPSIRLSNFSGNQNDLITLHRLTMLIDYADIADLHGVVYLGKGEQHLWDEKRWSQEINRAMPHNSILGLEK